MPATRLSPLDATFLEVESPTAHMHVGWAAAFEPPAERPSFEQLREHVIGRLDRAPRYRQKLAPVPLGIHDPEWVDDECFEPERHVLRASSSDLGEVVDQVMSVPLGRDRPLWEIWIADGLDDGRVGLVGKAHHCMVDGLAAVELATLLLDSTPEAPATSGESLVPIDVDGALDGEPGPAAAAGMLPTLARGLADRVAEPFGAIARAGRFVREPRQVFQLPARAGRVAYAVADSVLPPAPSSILNRRGSPLRHLASVRRPLDDLRAIKNEFGTTVNDVLLAVTAGALRDFAREQGDRPIPLKTMVPVSVRSEDDAFGNRISFLFVMLPCDEPDPAQRLMRVHETMSRRKEAGEPEDSNVAIEVAGYLPPPMRRVVARLISSPRMFNLVVSNIPGPRVPMYLRGCELLEAYPVVPLADEHALSVGMTTIRDDVCFGLYADRRSLPDVDRLAEHVSASISELRALAP
jgi:diacylglycerol O-acyltransferase